MNTEVSVWHLLGQACPECGHPALAHYRETACTMDFCRCHSDPICEVCGDLTSQHGDTDAL